MSIDELHRLAQSAESPEWGEWWTDDDALERFAALVAAAEREACAKVCEEWFTPNLGSEATAAIAAAIRARNEK